MIQWTNPIKPELKDKHGSFFFYFTIFQLKNVGDVTWWMRKLVSVFNSFYMNA